MFNLLEKFSNFFGFSKMKEESSSEIAKNIAANIKRINYDRSTNTASMKDIKDE